MGGWGGGQPKSRGANLPPPPPPVSLSKGLFGWCALGWAVRCCCGQCVRTHVGGVHLVCAVRAACGWVCTGRGQRVPHGCGQDVSWMWGQCARCTHCPRIVPAAPTQCTLPGAHCQGRAHTAHVLHPPPTPVLGCGPGMYENGWQLWEEGGPPPPGPRCHSGRECNLQTDMWIWVIFGTQTFGSQTPPPPSLSKPELGDRVGPADQHPIRE